MSSLEAKKNEMCQIIQKQLDDGKLDKSVRKIIVGDDGVKKQIVVQITDPREYLRYLIDRMKKVKGEFYNEEYYLNSIMKDNLHIDQENEMKPPREVNDVEIQNLTDSMDGINVKGKVLEHEIKIVTKNDKTWHIAKIQIGNSQGVAEINSLFYDQKYDEIFERMRNDTLKGETIYVMNAYTKTNKYSTFPFVINVKREGNIQIIEDDNEKITDDFGFTSIKDINDKTPIVNLRGKIQQIYESRTNKWTNPDTQQEITFVSQTFVLMNTDGASINVNVGNNLADNLPEAGTEIEIQFGKVIKDNYRVEKGYQNPYVIKVINPNQIKVLGTSSDEYPESVSLVTKNADMYDAKLIPISFNAMLFDLKWEKWDMDLRTNIPKKPYYLSCNTDGCRKKVTELDGVYMCSKHDVVTDTVKKRFMCNGTITDFTNEFQVLISGDHLENIFGMTEEQLLEEYESMEHYVFFSYINNKLTLDGNIFHVKGILKTDEWGTKFQISSIEKTSSDNFVKEEFAKISL
jgi:hypothetical protein